MKLNARVDKNQKQITKYLRDLGATVQPLHMVGRGVPDLLIGWKGKNILVELKDGSLVPSRRKLTDDEKEWHETWRGQAVIANSFDELIKILKDI